MKGKIVDEILSHFMRHFKALCNKSCKECKDKNCLICAKVSIFTKILNIVKQEVLNQTNDSKAKLIYLIA